MRLLAHLLVPAASHGHRHAAVQDKSRCFTGQLWHRMHCSTCSICGGFCVMFVHFLTRPDSDTDNPSLCFRVSSITFTIMLCNTVYI